MAQTHDHEIVSIYPFTDHEVDQLMENSMECVLMWATKDGWPVGVTHAYVWHEGKIWITFAEHRHRTTAIRRDNRVSVNVSSNGYNLMHHLIFPVALSLLRALVSFFRMTRPKNGFIPLYPKN